MSVELNSGIFYLIRQEVNILKYVLRSEVHIINRNHSLFNYCDDVCFKSKNLYNYVNYLMRKEFIGNGVLKTSAFDYNKLLKNEDVYKALPAKTSQQVIIKLNTNWQSFFKAIKDWNISPSKYTGMPKLPNYKEKNGRNIVMFDYQQGTFKNGRFKFPKTKLYIETNIPKDKFRQVQIVPYGSCYKVCIVYRKQIKVKEHGNLNYLSVDLGVDNLATLTNNIGQQPIVINGKVIKSINQYYNKKLGRLRSYVGKVTSNRIQKLNTKRNNKIDTHFHRISRFIVDYAKTLNIDNIVIGRNKDWQRSSNMNKKSNQKFVSIPFEKLINQIQYKAEELGINVIINEESYTSKASFIDGDMMTKGTEFSGKRISRSLYRSKNRTIINADVNGSYNILRKCNHQFSYEVVEGVSLHPIRLTV